MKLIVNGDLHDLPGCENLEQLLAHLQVPAKQILVEKNAEAIPRDRFATCPIREGDRVEIVRMVAGG
jgi:sulfur carrier protein